VAEGLTTTDGQPVDLDQAEKQFHASMAAPDPAEPTHPAPPLKDPEAPYGRKADGTPRKRAPGPGRGKTGARVNSAPAQPAPDVLAARQRRAEGCQGSVPDRWRHDGYRSRSDRF
jgi:hypothetical protein